MKLAAFILLFFTSSLFAQQLDRDTINVKAHSITSAKREEVNWQTTSLDNTLSNAKHENKYILLYFTAKWCGPCKVMDQSVFHDHSVTNIVQNFLAIKIDIDSWRAQTWLKRFSVRSMPTFFILDTTGKPLRHQIGAMNSKQFLAFLESPSANADLKALDFTLNNSKKYKRQSKLSLGFGTGISTLTNIGADETFGYDAKVGISIEKKRVLLNPYLQFASIGSSHLGLKYLRLPIDFGFNAYRGQILGLAGGYRVLAGPYYAMLLDQSGYHAKKYDFGFNYGIGGYIGDIDRLSLEVAFKVSQGFIDVIPLTIKKQSSRYFSFSVNLGFKKD